MTSTVTPMGDTTSPPTPPPRHRPHESALTPGDSARYDSRFASRAAGIVSSVMRDLMSLSERPDIISLAGGFPNTEAFEREVFDDVMEVVARDHLASSLQYGPTEGMGELRERIVDVMAHEGARARVEDIMVTSGGQQAIDLSIRTFVNPGDTVLAEGPTYPGAVPCFTTYEAEVEHVPMDDDGLRIDLVEEALDRLAARGQAAQAALHDPELPEPGRRDHVAGAPRAPGRPRARARAADRGGQPLRPDPLRGRPAAHALGARRRRRLGDLPVHVLEDPRARRPHRLGRRPGGGAAQDEPGQAGGRPRLLDHLAALRRRVPAPLRLARVRGPAQRHLPAAARRDAAGARGGDAARGALDAALRRPVRLGDPARVPRHDQPAGLGGGAAPGGLRARARGVPRRPRRRRDAPELLRGRRGRDQRGRAAPRASRSPR